MPHFRLESQYASHSPVCGVDEAGRGPWAGPVVAAAVIFPAPIAPEALNDSKQLSPKAREALFEQLPALAHIGVGVATVEEIDTLNIWGATALAMRRAVLALPMPPAFALVDGKLHPAPFPCPTFPVIGGDGISCSIAAASIIAKVTRDRMMEDLARAHPHYGFERHAGYGTAAHRAALEAHGPCPAHRRSFKPIRALLEAA